MEKLLAVLLAVNVVGAIGCASAPLNAQESSVRILRKSDAPATCKESGRVYGGALVALTDEGRENHMKKQAAKRGADTIVIEKTDVNGTIYGIAYNCATTAAN